MTVILKEVMVEGEGASVDAGAGDGGGAFFVSSPFSCDAAHLGLTCPVDLLVMHPFCDLLFF